MEAAGEEKTAAAMTATGEPLFTRRIEFHQARRPYTGVPISSGDFRLEILNPSNLDERRAASSCGVGPSASEAGEHVKRSAGGEVYDHGLDPELSFRISFQRIGAGLENLGNTCYLNSVLQCLTYTEPFAAYLHSGKHKSTCRAAGFCALCALQNHVMDALQSTGKILRPFHLVRNLRCISRSFRNSRQEDAHEYMVNLLESMHRCCLPSGVPTESPSAYEKSLVHKIFGGQLRSQVKCMQCSYCSNKFDPFLDLSLEIVRADSLRKAFAHFTATEELDGGEKQYQCQRCKEKVQAFKQLTIHKAPYVLTIHLKRFGSSIRGEKISKKVEFETTLDLKPFVSGSQEGELKYTLYGVLVHAGWSTHSGHYFCYVRTSSGLWYSLDDNHVSQVSEKTVLSREAYMLFYVKDRATNIKRSVEAKLNTGIFANSNGNKGIQSAEGKLNSALCSSSSAKTRHDVIFQSLSKMGSSMQNQPKNQQRTAFQFKEVSVDVKEGNAIKSAQETAPVQKMETICTTSGKDDKRPLRFSNAMTGPIKEAANSIKLKENKAHFSDTKGQKDGVSLTKNVKVPLKAAKGPYLGRRQLFFVSLRLHKKKKRRTKTYRRNSTTNNEMNGWMADPCADPLGVASTSDTIEIKREGFIRQGKEIRARRKEGGEILESFPASARQQTTVARWDAKGLLAAPVHEYDDPPKRSIGYLLDEWDEEYDRGKRKKLKSRQWFVQSNPFQKTADLLRTQRSSSSSRFPLRI